MSLPVTYILDALRKLDGSARVTYAAGSVLKDKVIERVVTVPLAKKELPWFDADHEYSECQLVFQQVVGYDEDQQSCSVYRRWEKLPAAPFTTTRINDRGDLETVTVTRGKADMEADANSLLQTSSVVQSDDGRTATKITTTVAEHSTLRGTELDRTTGLQTPYTSTIGPADTAADANQEKQPRDGAKSEFLTYAPNTGALDAFVRTLHGNTTISLPDVLTAVNVYWISATGDGAYTDNPNGTDAEATTARNFNIAIHRRASAEASVSLIADINAKIERRGSVTVPCVDYLFYVPNGTTRAAILTKLAGTTFAHGTVSEWPAFRPVSHDFTLRGGKLSASRNVDAQVHLSVSNYEAAYGRATGRGTNHDVGPSIRTITLPPTIHATIPSLGGDGATHGAVTATVDASADAVIGASVGFPSPEVLSTDVFSPSVTPTSLDATTPSAIPSAGLYLIDLDSQLFRDGYTVCRARVIDAANL